MIVLVPCRENYKLWINALDEASRVGVGCTVVGSDDYPSLKIDVAGVMELSHVLFGIVTLVVRAVDLAADCVAPIKDRVVMVLQLHDDADDIAPLRRAQCRSARITRPSPLSRHEGHCRVSEFDGFARDQRDRLEVRDTRAAKGLFSNRLIELTPCPCVHARKTSPVDMVDRIFVEYLPGLTQMVPIRM